MWLERAGKFRELYKNRTKIKKFCPTEARLGR